VREKEQEEGAAWHVPEGEKPIIYSEIRRYAAKAEALIREHSRIFRKRRAAVIEHGGPPAFALTALSPEAWQPQAKSRRAIVMPRSSPAECLRRAQSVAEGLAVGAGAGQTLGNRYLAPTGR
jgi:hypothetical protein